MRALAAAAVFVAIGGSVAADDGLRSVERKLDRARRESAELTGAATGLLGEIEGLDRRESDARAELARLDRELGRAAERRRAAENELARLERERIELRAALLARAPGLQRITRRGLGPLLFEGSADRETRGRHQRYVASIVSRDRELLNAVVANREAVALERSVAGEAERQLGSLRRDRARTIERVQKERGEKERRLASLRAEGEAKESLVRELEAAAARLRELLTRRPPTGAPRARNAPAGWRWPLDRIRAVAAARNGIELAAPRGTKIRAVADGTVVFADWFPGYGKLIVIDHGGHWHSIYGHAEDVLARANEEVAAGQEIATVGSTGATGDASLYFELRSRGEPRDPEQVLGERRVEKAKPPL